MQYIYVTVHQVRSRTTSTLRKVKCGDALTQDVQREVSLKRSSRLAVGEPAGIGRRPVVGMEVRQVLDKDDICERSAKAVW